MSHRPISELKRLKFAQPADLPVQQAVMVTNLKTAKALRGPGGGCAQHHGWCCFWRYMKARPRGARSVAAKLLTKDEARRIAANAAKLPELVLRC